MKENVTVAYWTPHLKKLKVKTVVIKLGEVVTGLPQEIFNDAVKGHSKVFIGYDSVGPSFLQVLCQEPLGELNLKKH